MRYNELYDCNEPEWRSVLDCSCNISELRTDPVIMPEGYKSAVMEWLENAERAMPAEATFDLEAELAQED